MTMMQAGVAVVFLVVPLIAWEENVEQNLVLIIEAVSSLVFEFCSVSCLSDLFTTACVQESRSEQESFLIPDTHL